MKRVFLGLVIGLFHLPFYWCLSLTSNFNYTDQNNVTSNDTIVFICNGNISNVILDWYVNDEVVATYTYREGHIFPRSISPLSMNSEYEVQISSANSDYGFVNFANFTLAIHQCDIATLGEDRVQCGNPLVKSNTIEYGLANLTEKINLTSTAMYSGSDGLIQEAILNLENLEFGCDFNISYYVSLKVNSTTVCSTIITPFDCSGETCSFSCKIPKAIALKNSFVYGVITVNNVTNIYSPEVPTSALRIFGNSSTDSCAPAIMCSESYGGDCVIQYGSDPEYEVFDSANTISPGNTVDLLISDSTSQIFVQVTRENGNSKFVLQYDLQNDNSLKSSDDTFVLAIGWIALIVGIILNIFGYIRTGIYWKCFKRNGKMIIVGFLLISAIFLVTAVALFISYYTTYKEESCGTKVRNYAIALSAGVISLIYCAYSAYLTGAIYILPKIDMFDNEKSSMDTRNLTFGKKMYNLSDNARCIDCDKYLWRWELCQSCSKYMCKVCSSDAFIPRNMKMGKVCRSCDQKYCEENEAIMKADSVAELAKLQSTVTDGACCVCNQLKHVDYKCSSCSQNICKKHFMKLPIEVTEEFCIDEDKYCCFCFEIYSRKYDYKKRTQTTTSL